MFTQKTLDRAKDIYHQYCAKIQEDLNLSDSDLVDKLTVAYKEIESFYSKKATETNNHSVTGKISFYSSALEICSNRRTTTDKEWYNSQFFKLAAYEHLFAVFKGKYSIEYHLYDSLKNIDLQFDVIEDQKIETLYFSAEGDYAKEIFKHLKETRTIKTLNIENTFNSTERLEDIIDLLNNNNSISSLDIVFYSEIEDQELLSQFFDSLSNNINIESLLISFVDLTRIDIESFTKMVENNQSINQLYFSCGESFLETKNLKLFNSALEKNLYLTDYESPDTYNYLSENEDGDNLQCNKLYLLLERNKNFVKQVAKFLVQKFVLGEEFSLGKEIKYLKHYQASDKKLLKEYIDEETKSSDIDPSKIELVSDTNIQRYIAENFLKLSMVTKGTDPDELSFEQISTTDDELSLEQVSGNSKKRKISDDTSGPSKVRKLESSSVTLQEKTYLSEEMIAKIASFLGPKNLWHIDTNIVPSIEHNTDELDLMGSSEIVEA